MVNHELITLLTDEKLDIDAPLRGSVMAYSSDSSGTKYGLVIDSRRCAE
jgi:hypothetical protein